MGQEMLCELIAVVASKAPKSQSWYDGQKLDKLLKFSQVWVFFFSIIFLDNFLSALASDHAHVEFQKHIKKDLVDPAQYTEEERRGIPYTNVV